MVDSGLYECNEDAGKREAVLGRIDEVTSLLGSLICHLNSSRCYDSCFVCNSPNIHKTLYCRTSVKEKFDFLWCACCF